MSYTERSFKFRCDWGESRRTSSEPGQREYLKDVIEMFFKQDVSIFQTWESLRRLREVLDLPDVRGTSESFGRVLDAF